MRRPSAHEIIEALKANGVPEALFEVHPETIPHVFLEDLNELRLAVYIWHRKGKTRDQRP
jgi:hypothetical protein